MKTETITFNLNDRGRSHTGQPRRFNIKKLMAVVNGAATQERVKQRDMLGYYGHWPREKFGMLPAEGGIADGKAHAVEPALVTTFLHLAADGSLSHQCEFLDTGPGQVAAKLHAQRVGGWSSAIDHETNPRAFYGLDYVLNPNFSTNRGYALDSTHGGADAVLDAVAEYNDHITATLALYSGLQTQYDDALKMVGRLAAENEELLSVLARKGAPTVALDSLGVGKMPMAVSGGATEAFLRTMHGFATANLEPVAEPKKQPKKTQLVQDVEELVFRLLHR